MSRQPYFVLATLAVITNANFGCAAEAGPGSGTSAVADTGLALQLAELEPGSGRIEYTLTNHTESPVHLLRWKTAMVANHDQLFRVYRDGSEVPYRGAYFVRPKSVGSDYIELGAGQSLTAQVNLTSLYELSDGGTYEVRALPVIERALREPEGIEVHADVSLDLDVNPERGAAGGAAVASKSEALTLFDCDIQQGYAIAQANYHALQYATEAVDHYFDPATGWDSRAQTWFGNYDSGRAYWIGYKLNGIYQTLLSDNIGYTCDHEFGVDCEDGALAVMYPGLPIQLCEPFFDLTLTGENSQAHTVLHEIAHWYYTYDIAYESVPVRQLAIDHPDQSVNNADTYAYYVLNVPVP